MKKINDFFRENRSFRFLFLLFILGAIGIGVMTIIDNSDTIFTSPEEEPPIGVLEDLQEDITVFESKTNWKLEDYNIVEVSITTSAEAELISGTTKGNLITTLNNALERKTFQRCEEYLMSQKNDNPSELKQLLNTLLNVVASKNKIIFYKAQIDKYIFYEKDLPSKVDNFVKDFHYYDDDKYFNYLEQIAKKPGFDKKYKNHSKFKAISKNLKDKLDKFNIDFYKQ